VLEIPGAIITSLFAKLGKVSSQFFLKHRKPHISPLVRRKTRPSVRLLKQFFQSLYVYIHPIHPFLKSIV
jgi:hypothetical protein